MLETECMNKYTFFFSSELFFRIKTFKRLDLGLPENHAEDCLWSIKISSAKVIFFFHSNNDSFYIEATFIDTNHSKNALEYSIEWSSF